MVPVSLRSGHGSQERDPTGEETSGLNDTILPCDFKRAGQISDNELNQRLCALQPSLPSAFQLQDAPVLPVAAVQASVAEAAG